jgi:hypothetical protein
MSNENEINFDKFLKALESTDSAKGEATPLRVTAHSSSVATDDWEKVEKVLREQEGSSR